MALRILADRLEHGEADAELSTSSFVDWARNDLHLSPVESSPRGRPSPRLVGWIDAFLDSEGFEAQLAQTLGGRQALEPLKKLLRVLDRHGGKFTLDALARSLNAPSFRLRSILAISTRLLNLDGYEVLEVDSASDSVALNRELLETQFELRERE